MGNVQLVNLVKSFGDLTVIKDANLEIQNGEFTVFVGPSGCGKSTMLRIIAGLESVTDGEIRIDGTVVNKLPPVERGISMVFQSYALYPHLSVYENIAFPLRVAKMSKAEIDERVQHAARVLQLENRLSNKPGELSGGQRQRVAIGRSIVREPKVFLFDEPLSNLDAALRADMRVELSALHRELKNTMIYVTHDQIEAMTMADKIVVLEGGRISQVGSPLELYHKPANLFVAGFIGNPSMNFLQATYKSSDDNGVNVSFSGHDLHLPVAAKDLAAGTKITLGIRPDEMEVDGPNGQFQIVPKVVEYLGNSTVVYADHELAEDRIRLVLTGTTAVKEGEPLTVGFRNADCHLFDNNGLAFERGLDLSDVTGLPESYLSHPSDVS